MTLAWLVFARVSRLRYVILIIAYQRYQTHQQFTGSHLLGNSPRRRRPLLSTLSVPPDTVYDRRAHRTSDVAFLHSFVLLWPHMPGPGIPYGHPSAIEPVLLAMMWLSGPSTRVLVPESSPESSRGYPWSVSRAR